VIGWPAWLWELRDQGIVRVDGAGNLVITDENNHRIRAVTP